MSCYLQLGTDNFPSELEHLHKLSGQRQYNTHKMAIEAALELLVANTKDTDTNTKTGASLLRRLVPLFYCQPYISHLL